MDIKENLASDLKISCNIANVDFEEIRNGLAKFLGEEVISDYFIAQGPTPHFPDTLFDVFVLSEKCLYDYEIRKKGSLEHFLILSQIDQISEAHTGEDHLEVEFYSGGATLILTEKLQRLHDIQDFLSKVRSQILKHFNK